jgi:hypothetical protein
VQRVVKRLTRSNGPFWGLGFGIFRQCPLSEERARDVEESLAIREDSVSAVRVGELLEQNLQIPGYQRPYSWEPATALQLLDDIRGHLTTLSALISPMF